MATSSTPAKVNFHFDPACPLAWRTALWIREARKVRPIDVTWRFFSLEIVNRKEGATPNFQTDLSWPPLRTLALVRKEQGNEAVERLYLALGNAFHGPEGGSMARLSDLNIIRDALKKADLDPALVDRAVADESTYQEIVKDHEEAKERYLAFGVPTIALEGSDIGFYGPVINTVPKGEEAGELWDHYHWLLHQPNIYELKRERGRATWGPVSSEN